MTSFSAVYVNTLNTITSVLVQVYTCLNIVQIFGIYSKSKCDPHGIIFKDIKYKSVPALSTHTFWIKHTKNLGRISVKDTVNMSLQCITYIPNYTTVFCLLIWPPSENVKNCMKENNTSRQESWSCRK